MDGACTREGHEADKLSPLALELHYDTHAELWNLGGNLLRLHTCKRCHSTILTLVQP